MNRNTDRKENKNGKWIGIVIFLLLTAPELIPFAIIGGIIWLIVKSVSKQQSTSGSIQQPTTRGTTQRTSTRYTTRQKSFDECPQSLFCRHTDKSEHHIRQGREIDPWDRPDIDISKYQRNR